MKEILIISLWIWHKLVNIERTKVGGVFLDYNLMLYVHLQRTEVLVVCFYVVIFYVGSALLGLRT